MSQLDADLKDLILQLIPKDGTSIGNIKLQKQLTEAAAFSFDEEDYKRVREVLIADGVLGKGRGRGGAVFLAQAPASKPLRKISHCLNIGPSLKKTR